MTWRFEKLGADINTGLQTRTPSRNHDRGGEPESQTLKVLVFLEASNVAGAVKPILEFAREAAAGKGDRDLSLTLALYARSGQESKLTDYLRELGIPVEIIAERHTFDLQVIPQLRELQRKLQPDIVWTNNTKSHFLVRLSGLHRSCEWIAFHHGYTKEARRTRVYNELDRWSLPRARRVVTVCNDFARQLESKGVPADRIRVVRNPIRVSPSVGEAERARLRAQLGVDDAGVLLSVGRLSREKGHADLLRAMQKLCSSSPGPRSRLVIVGDGPERGALQALCFTLKLEHCVTFTGHQADVGPYYAIADIFVLPSHSEGSPNVLLEALAAELPIVATAVGGVPEVLSNELDALLVPSQAPEALANAITRLLQEPQLRQRLIANGKAVVAKHDPQAYFRNVLGIFEEVMGEGAAARH
ncbi:MAG TPA: glycosyltransferase [Terriglobales bacterium]|nr:glycosyltransferase [Terriglobales bacterium]